MVAPLAVTAACVGMVGAASIGSAAGPLTPAVVRATVACTGWTSESDPPATIRVLRTAGADAGTVAVVPFRDYVNVVMAAEWGPGNPTEALRAGAVAVKEYAWYRAMVWRGKTADDGSCYDVVDSTVDQVYAPEAHAPVGPLTAAVDATWAITALRSGHLFATHYEGGSNVGCAADADGRRLFQNSAMRCARDGMTAEAILGAYYFPDVEVVGSLSTGPSASASPSATPVAPATTTLTLAAGSDVVTWGHGVRLAARLAANGSQAVGGRTVHLQRSTDGVAWTTIADLATDTAGTADVTQRPATNATYRLALDATVDLSAATSPGVRVVVRRLARMQPGAAAATRHVARGTTVSFATLVRPASATAAPGPVEYRLLHLVGRAWVVARTWTVTPDAAGWARLRVTLASGGSWTVRAAARGTDTNAGSAWAAGPRYDVQ